MSETSADTALDLGSELDITMVAALRERLAAAAASGEMVELDGTRIARADAAGIQLLLAFDRAAEAGWKWAGGATPEPVRAAATTLGAAATLAPESIETPEE